MASTDARPVPIKNTAYRITFPIMDADGDLVTGASSLDSEVSKDGATFADCTNEATEIATSSGMYYLDITSTEMNADTVAIIVKTATSGAKTTAIVLYPQETGDILVDVQSISGDDAAANNLEALLDDTGAALKVTSLVVTAGVDISNSTTDGPGVAIAGNGTGSGLRLTGGATGSALRIIGGATSGYGIYLTTTDGDGVYVVPDGDANHGIYVKSSDSGECSAIRLESVTVDGGNGLACYGSIDGHGIYAYGGDTGVGMKLIGGDTSGEGLLATTTSGDAIRGVATSGNGLGLFGGAAGHGIEAQSGSDAGAIGLKAHSNSSAGQGASFTGAGANAGMLIQGGATGHGLRLVGGATSGSGLYVGTTSGDAINIDPTAGHGIYIEANGTDKHGIYAIGGTGGTSDGINAPAGSGGVGLRGSGIEYLIALTYNPASKPGAADSLLNTIIENDGGVPRFTANALEQAASGGGGLDAAGVRAALGMATADLDTQLDAILAEATAADAYAASADSGITALAADIGADGAGLTDIPWNADWDAEVQSECDDALQALHLQYLFQSAYNPASKPGNASGLLNVVVESDGGVPRFTANALEQGPSGSGLDAAGVRAALGMASADLDTQLDTISTNLGAPASGYDDISSMVEYALGLIGSVSTSVLNNGYAVSDVVDTLTTLGTYITRIPVSPAEVGSAMTLANDSITSATIADDTFTDAMFVVPDTPVGPAEGVLSMVLQLWRRHFKKVALNSSALITYGDDDSTVLTTQTRTEASTTQTLGAAT